MERYRQLQRERVEKILNAHAKSLFKIEEIILNDDRTKVFSASSNCTLANVLSPSYRDLTRTGKITVVIPFHSKRR